MATKPLTDLFLKKLNNPNKKKYSDGGGLHLFIAPSGSKLWHMSYRFGGKEKVLSFGPYPLISLKEAREKRDAAKRLLLDGIDPGQKKREQKEQDTHTFEKIFDDWFKKFYSSKDKDTQKRMKSYFIKYVFPYIGSRPIRELAPKDIWKCVERMEQKGIVESAHRTLSYCGHVFRYATANGFAERDITTGGLLNAQQAQQQHFKLLDVVVMPNNDPKKGLTDVLSEDVLVETLFDVIGRYHNEVKVWNMSLATNRLCNDSISDLASILDEIQDTFGVEMIIPTGNYIKPPLKQWPPLNNLNGQDRLFVPADSVRAITVGSVANIGIDLFADKDMPSSFSRIGPGANFLIKPEIVYYGGNCKDDMQCLGTGVISFDINGNLVEGIGTSYAAPAIASIYAGLRYGLNEERSQEFSKAFLIHSASIPAGVKKSVKEYNKYFGYGIPEVNIEDILTCSPSSVTQGISTYCRIAVMRATQ